MTHIGTVFKSIFQNKLPEPAQFDASIRRAPYRRAVLSKSDKRLAVENALRYVPKEWHKELAVEFAEELETKGRIYAYRFRPVERIYAKPIEDYSGKTLSGRALQLMIDNNLDIETALYPYELVTYGETGQVCQNWLQYHLIQHYLREMEDDQTLVVQSGHPLGLFESNANAPRAIVTNALMVGAFDNSEEWARASAIGVANYGQMTAGGWMYIGPQGIVHGTYNTLSIAGRMKLGIPESGNLAGKLFVSSGLGGMSGAQPKAVEIAGGVGIIAEVDGSRVTTRHDQGWVSKMCSTPDVAFQMATEAVRDKTPLSIGFEGNIIDLLQYAVDHNVKIDLLSDQTSCHAPYEGGYCPHGISFEQRTDMLAKNRELFNQKVDASLKVHFELIKKLTAKGTYFFDYGNSFMKAIFDAGVTEIVKNGQDEREGFIWPSYVEDILGPELFDYGYGPFRWVCLSGDSKDLKTTDDVAADVIASLRENPRYQDRDNEAWVRNAGKNEMVVGSQARILYQDATGRMELALKFNDLVRNKTVGPIMLGRDHHDTGGTDSPFRETSNIKDGSNIMADMATQCFAGNAARGMTLCALHNGGGVGIGKSINGGFGLLLDGSTKTDEIIKQAMPWDVMVGVSRRAWARNPHSIETCEEFNESKRFRSVVSIPECVDNDIASALF